MMFHQLVRKIQTEGPQIKLQVCRPLRIKYKWNDGQHTASAALKSVLLTRGAISFDKRGPGNRTVVAIPVQLYCRSC